MGNHMQGEDGYFAQASEYRSGAVGTPRKATSRRRVRRASLALALSRLEREHVALLLATCELEGPRSPTDTNPQVLREALLPLLREDLRQTQHALARAAQGTYGTCEECHRPISAQHLELKPAMTRCPACDTRTFALVRD
jgi:DnaK suppressor protein